MPDDARETKPASFIKAVCHNVGVVAVGFGFAFLGAALDSLFGLNRFPSLLAAIVGWLLLTIRRSCAPPGVWRVAFHQQTAA
jgi:hypothetical protein